MYTSHKNTPRWYKNFFLMDDEYIINANSCGFMDTEIMHEGKRYKFVISFGGADSTFDTFKFVDDFGMKVCLNCVDKFASVSKSNIATTMSNNKEVSTKRENLSNFSLNVETDLIKGITISPIKDNGITDGNMMGGISLGLSSEFNIENIEQLLLLLAKKYNSNDYKQKFDFIDNIKAIINKPLENRIQEKIVEQLKSKMYEKVWFGAPFFDEWEYVTEFLVIYKKTSMFYSDLFVEDIMNDFNIENFCQLNKIVVYPIYDENQGDGIKLSECLYGEIEIEGSTYVVNNNRYYVINNDYVNEICDQYNKIDIVGELPYKKSNISSEQEYNSYVSQCNEKWILFDTKLYNKSNVKFELCDIFDKENKMFIHVKKYGASSVLSHLFLQALNSAKFFTYNKEDVISFYKNICDIPNETNNNYTVAMAIITKEIHNIEKKISIPFFSKMSVVTTIKELRALGFKAGLIFVRTEKTLNNE